MTRDRRQDDVLAWTRAAFGPDQATSLPQRAVRLLEEALEAYQACSGDPEMAHRLVDFVFARPVGELRQEIGGVGVCTLALAASAGLSADAAERTEWERVQAKPLEHFQRRNAAKNEAGFLATWDGIPYDARADVVQRLGVWLVPCATERLTDELRAALGDEAHP